ncbi:MAG: FAD-dependent oxidoreductase [Thermoleophilaceae bacterium]|nr:FAD-dependent oxidoreductase [Thermoleophilaceae bacterium]
MRIEKHTAHGWWLEEAGEPAPRAALEGDRSADVVVVGGGFTGLWTAWHLVEAGARVALVEGGVCGHGPSGRNGGFCESLWLSGAAIRERFGDGAARALLDASSESVVDIGAWCRANDVDAWFDQSGYMCVSTAPGFDDVGAGAVDAAAALGAPERVVPLGAEEVRAHCASPVFRGGVMVPDFATLHPARLALGLRRRLIERGVEVFEHSRVTSLPPRRDGDGVRATTASGSVRAAAAVLAIGPGTRSVRRLRSRLTVTSSHIVLTEPVPDVLTGLGWTGGECITDGRTLVHYFRTTRDGRIVFGWGGGRPAFGGHVNGRAEVDGQAAAEALRSLLRLFPALEGRRITHAWGGPVDVSPSHIPQIGSLDGSPVHYAFGYTGNGVGPSQLAGRTLAALAAGRDDPVTELPIVGADAGAWVPPEPIAWLGGQVVRSALVRCERAEEDGRRAGPVTRAICAAPRALGIHLAR